MDMMVTTARRMLIAATVRVAAIWRVTVFGPVTVGVSVPSKCAAEAFDESVLPVRKKPGGAGLFSQLLLLLALRVGLIGVLMSGLRMLLSGIRMLFSLRMITFTVMFCCGAVCLGSFFVMFGRLIVFVSSHCNPFCLAPSGQQTRAFQGMFLG